MRKTDRIAMTMREAQFRTWHAGCDSRGINYRTETGTLLDVRSHIPAQQYGEHYVLIRNACFDSVYAARSAA